MKHDFKRIATEGSVDERIPSRSRNADRVAQVCHCFGPTEKL